MRRNVDLVAIAILLLVVLMGERVLELRNQLRFLEVPANAVRRTVKPQLIDLREELREAGRQLRDELRHECDQLRTGRRQLSRDAGEIRREVQHAKQEVRDAIREHLRME